MAYTPIHAWKRKDKLPSKDPQKIIYGEQLQDEFDAISNEINVLGEQAEEVRHSLYGSSVYGIALYSLGYSGGGYDDAQIKADLAAETNARIAGDAGLQTQIDNLPSGGGGGGASTWDELTGKPTEFPPEAHGHEEIAKDAAYIKYEGDTWKASPSMEVDGNLSVSGDSTLTGGLEVSGNIDASGSISVDGDLSITGKIEGDLTVNGNITIDGGQIVDPDGNPAGGSSTHVGDTAPDSPTEGQMWLNSDDGYLYVYYDNAENPTWMAVEREGRSGGGGGSVGPDPESAGSLYVQSSTGYLEVQSDDALLSPFALGDGDFTIEFWIRTSSRQGGCLNPHSNLTGSAWGLHFTQGCLRWQNSWRGAHLWECPQRIDDGVWHHVRVCRRGGLHIVYLDGVNKSALCTGSLTDTSDYSYESPPNLEIGSGFDPKVSLVLFADVRVIRNVALSTGPSFVVPTVPVVPSEDGANLLCVNFEEEKEPFDSSGCSHQLTLVKAQIDADSPYRPAVWVLVPVYLDADGKVLEIDNADVS